MTHSRQRIRDLLAAAGVEPRRSLGQNFVADPNTVRRVVRLAEVADGDAVVEVGPGVGSLTLALREAGADVLAIEIDPTLAAIVREVVDDGVTVLVADALTVDWPEVLAGRAQWKLIANLPYNVGTTIVLDVLEQAPMVDSLLIMVQHEVAQRLVAGPGSKTYGIPSVKVAWWADAAIVGSVPPTVFVPKPRVESSLVRLVRHDRQPDDVTSAEVAALVDTAFGQRRKMLRRSLGEHVGDHVFEAAGIDPTLRPEMVGVDGWIDLARAAGRDDVSVP
ncbi:MAG TPA: 16S rRNA (adenine(1518)-N(6)/adenine(1519)-N(6))-dimethyltransferase RsmA [Acidimicrobiales bacterium]|nr:16S rRNA (adenine(1518)-N(6)/adenine(1519)-N(6))-dimethyltransferase RsmA [Acidimicrobiales bacterium]